METRTRRRGHRRGSRHRDQAGLIGCADRTRHQIKDAPDFDGVVRIPGTDPLDSLGSYSRIYGRICGSGRL
jgi:hypothetical protein